MIEEMSRMKENKSNDMRMIPWILRVVIEFRRKSKGFHTSSSRGTWWQR
jgi:hypothetical protein